SIKGCPRCGIANRRDAPRLRVDRRLRPPAVLQDVFPGDPAPLITQMPQRMRQLTIEFICWPRWLTLRGLLLVHIEASVDVSLTDAGEALRTVAALHP